MPEVHATNRKTYVASSANIRRKKIFAVLNV